MRIRAMAIDGAWEVTPQQRVDPRGSFLEWCQIDQLSDAIGAPLTFEQGNISISALGVIRGIHFTDVPPGQAKYVTCVRGALWDVVVDLRTDSPTFRRWEVVQLDTVNHRSLYIAEGLGHALCALTPEATAVYLCSTAYDEHRGERAVHPLDPELGITWPTRRPILSARDASAPTLAELLDQRLLPSMQAGDHAPC